jgi:hypothetical protein
VAGKYGPPEGGGEGGGMRVPTSLLRCEWPPNDGVKPGHPHFDAIFYSIQKEGILEPITIDLEWFVIDGAHRLSAARILGIEYVEVRVWTGKEFVQ